MRKIETTSIIAAAEDLCITANNRLPDDVLAAIKDAAEREESDLGREVFAQILENIKIAERKGVPLCQDTGFAVFFVELGQDVQIVGGDFTEAINEGVRRGYRNGYLRKSICDDPYILRKNTGDNTPAVIHVRIVPGDKLKIIFAPKGAGSENMSAIRMLKPADGEEGIRKFVLEQVDKAGSNPCPPIVVGVGVGGTFEMAAILAKTALLRPLGSHNANPEVARLERELLEELNKTGIGPQGLGGRVTALGVNIETYPTHIASLPVAININCHVARHAEVVL